MNKSKVVLVASLVSAAFCCCAQGLPWMTRKDAPAAAKDKVELQRVDGVQIEMLGGQRFEKKDVNGIPAYVAVLPTPSGIHANANIYFDAQYGNALPSMDEYAQKTKEGYASMGLKSKVKEQDADTMIVTASNDQIAYFVKVIRDACKNRFVVVTGTVIDQGSGALEKEQLVDIAKKIERCVRSVRKDSGASACTDAGTPAPRPMPPCRTWTGFRSSVWTVWLLKRRPRAARRCTWRSWRLPPDWRRP